MVKSAEIYNAINEVENKAKKRIIEFFKAHNLTEMVFYPKEPADMDMNMDEDVYAKYEDVISSTSTVYALGHAKKWAERICLTKMEIEKNANKWEFYCNGFYDCNDYEGKNVELLPESYAEILEFLEAVEPYIEYYKNIA